MGRYDDSVLKIDDAIVMYQNFLDEKTNMIPSIGINYHKKGTDPVEDETWDFYQGNTIDLSGLKYFSEEFKYNQEVLSKLDSLVAAFPDADIIGKDVFAECKEALQRRDNANASIERSGFL